MRAPRAFWLWIQDSESGSSLFRFLHQPREAARVSCKQGKPHLDPTLFNDSAGPKISLVQLLT